MPNHVQNYLSVVGDDKEIARFLAEIKKGDRVTDGSSEFRILDNLYPTPPELLEGQGWYGWNTQHWGSKWGDYDGSVGGQEDGKLHLNFLSAWDTIATGIMKVSEQFPTLGFVLTYQEDGLEFCGVEVIKNGESIDSIKGEYPEMGDIDDDGENEMDVIEQQHEGIKVVVDALVIQGMDILNDHLLAEVSE